MALIYSATGSLDGYIADADDRFDFAEPDEELHGFVNDVVRRIDTLLIGRRSYGLMDYWDTVDLDGDVPAVEKDFARIWRRPLRTSWLMVGITKSEGVNLRKEAHGTSHPLLGKLFLAKTCLSGKDDSQGVVFRGDGGSPERPDF